MLIQSICLEHRVLWCEFRRRETHPPSKITVLGVVFPCGLNEVYQLHVLHVCYRCVNLLVRVWELDVLGELVSSKIFNPPFPVLKAGHSVSYSCVCDVCREWVNEVGFFLFFLFGSVLCTCFSCILHVFYMYKGQRRDHNAQADQPWKYNSI